MNEETKPAKKRPDRAEKLQARKFHDETVIKCSVGKLLLLQDEQKKDFLRCINKLVDSCSTRTHYASVALNALVREMIDGVDDLSCIAFPPIWDETFIRQLIVGTQTSKIKYPEIDVLYQVYPHLAPNIERFSDDYNVYTSAALKMATNIKTHLQTNLQQVMKKYLYNATGLNKEEVFNIMNTVWGWKREAYEDDNIDEDAVQLHVDIIRDYLLLDEDATINKKWLKDVNNLDSIFKFMIHVNRSLQHHEKPLNRILPLQRLRMHHITIDSSTLFGILKKIGIMQDIKNNPLGHGIWEGVYDFSKILRKEHNFTGTIDTDGVALSAHFWKFNKEKQKYHEGLEKAKLDGCEEEWKKEYTSKIKKEKPDLEGKRVLGCDPGRVNILTIVEVLDSGKIVKYVLTRNRYYNDSGIFEARKNTIKWNNNVKDELLALSKNSPKSVSLDDFTKFIELKITIDATLWEEYRKARWRQQQLRLYGGKKRAFARFFNEIGDLENAIIAYGNAKLVPGGKGEISVPTSRAYKECESRCETYPQEEFRSSSVHYEDDSILQMVVRKDTNKTVRGLLWCSSTNKNNGKFVDRDVNGALNIRRCFMADSLPQIMRRGNPKIVKTVGKQIRC